MQDPNVSGCETSGGGEHYSHSPQLWDGIQLKNFRYITYVDAATLDDTQGIIIAEYKKQLNNIASSEELLYNKLITYFENKGKLK